MRESWRREAEAGNEASYVEWPARLNVTAGVSNQRLVFRRVAGRADRIALTALVVAVEFTGVTTRGRIACQRER
jgi:hypothetical protein